MRVQYGPEAPVPIFQHEAEFKRLLDVFTDLQPQRTLEVGTFHGGTLYHFATNSPPGAVVVSIDSYAVGVDNRHLYAAWNPEVQIVALEGDSSDRAVIHKASEYAPYDFVFIDAGHRLNEVQKDWVNYRPFVADGGLIAFHDILENKRFHPEIEVADLWRQIQAEGHITEEIVVDRDAAWGGIGIVYL